MGEAKKQRLAILLSKEESQWESCQVIVPNLFKLYRKSFPCAHLEVFDYNEQMTEYEYFCTFRELVEFAPDKIIICDHKPHPERVIKDLMQTLEGSIPAIYCHLFGDFSLYANPWLEIECLLQRVKIQFIAASHRQVAFVRQFIEGGERFVHYLPFPVDEEKYYFSPKGRVTAREKLCWDEMGQGKHKHFLYTGRLSAQKNIIPLVQSFAEFLKLSGLPAHLHIVGAFDDLAYPFFGIYHPPEFYRYQFFQLLEELEWDGGGIRDRIHLVGHLAAKELRDYYHACDVFTSLSLHNDEDYGMSPAEALCSGMPLILSDWGGHASFHLPEMQKVRTSLARVKEVDSIYEINYVHFIKLLMKYGLEQISDDERVELSRVAQEQFGIAGNVQQLLKIHSRPMEKFSGWNQKFQLFADRFVKNGGNPFGITDISEKSRDLEEEESKICSRKIYRECYNEYLSHS